MPAVAVNGIDRELTTAQLLPTAAPRTADISLGEFGAMLQRFAHTCGSQKALARQLGVTQQLISLIVSGKRQPGRKLLSALGARRKVVIEIEVEVGNGGSG